MVEIIILNPIDSCKFNFSCTLFILRPILDLKIGLTLMPNHVLPIYVNQVKSQSSREEITIGDILHPPSALLPNLFFFVTNNLDIVLER